MAGAEGYTFIYVSALTGHVIPRHAVEEGDYEAFVDAVVQKVAEAKKWAGHDA